MKEKPIEFVGQILDNVHGFISYTRTEEKIMDTQLFKRLQSIKQLSVVNFVFPGSEHTRFLHSLGVMHIADKMAISLGLCDKDRRLVRLAGLLHDIGHYPLSHVCEVPYKKPFTLEELPDTDFCKNLNEKIRRDIDSFSIKVETTLMSKSDGLHHEAIGALILQSNDEIKKLIADDCGDEYAPQIIAEIITGNVEHEQVDPLLVQIIHSELDADGIDYLMRDSTFAGTSFGKGEIDQLIRCLVPGEYKGKKILCIQPKGIAAADQYIINKFFSYSQVVFNRHIVISEWMSECVVDWMQKHHAIFPSGAVLKKWAGDNTNTNYLDFTDNMFWSALTQILTDELNDLVPHYIKVFCEYLLHHNEPRFIRESEVKFITNDSEEAKKYLIEADIVKDDSLLSQRITILNHRCMTKQVPINKFREELKKEEEDSDPAQTDENIPDPEVSRLMECISVLKPDGSIQLLCDDERSLMRTMYNSTLVTLRSYEFPQGN